MILEPEILPTVARWFAWKLFRPTPPSSAIEKIVVSVWDVRIVVITIVVILWIIFNHMQRQ